MKLAILTTAAILASLAFACASDPPGDAEVSMRVEWLGEPSASIPSGVTKLRLLKWEGDVGPAETNLTVAGLDERDGRRYFAGSFLSGLPEDTPVLVRVEGQADDGSLVYIGHVGPLRLAQGERRHVDLRMYRVGSSTSLGPSPAGGRILSAATALPDGRVLVSGGFDRMVSGSCPTIVPVGARCFELMASSEAYLFEPASGRFLPVEGGMLAARGGHTATAMPDGSVLVAGGASRALLAFAPIGDPITGYTPIFEPLAGDGGTAHASFELFSPGPNAELEDTERDGDPGRGGFLGAADAAGEVGRLNDPRFLHAAAPVPGQDGRVILVGGFGSMRSAQSYEVFDARRPGGWGVYANEDDLLGEARTTPAAVAIDEPASVWIFGGSIARSADDLAEVWTPDTSDPTGAIDPGAEGIFPRRDMTDSMEHPDFSLTRPLAAPIAGTHALVVGWLGPRCDPGTTTPRFSATTDGSGTEPCPAPMTGGGFTVNGSSGAAVPTSVGEVRSFGDVVTLDDGAVVFTGGVGDRLFTRRGSAELFNGALSGNEAVRVGTPRYTLVDQRAFHSSAAMPNQAVVTVGGVSFSTDLSSATLVETAEVLYLQRPPTPRE